MHLHLYVSGFSSQMSDFRFQTPECTDTQLSDFILQIVLTSQIVLNYQISIDLEYGFQTVLNCQIADMRFQRKAFEISELENLKDRNWTACFQQAISKLRKTLCF